MTEPLPSPSASEAAEAVTRPGPARVAGLLLFLGVAGVFLPAIKNGFVNYDDQDYVTANARVQGGLTWDNVRWAFRTHEAANWHPVTWLSHLADCQLFGLAPWGHHLTSVLLHALNAVLVFWLWRKMTGAYWRSLFLATLFGLHPIHVESVAWVSERKDLLSTLFFLLALGAYADWTTQAGRGSSSARTSYGKSLLFFALGLMSKPMVVTFPFVLLLLDYWPLRRPGVSGWRLVGEKIPFLALSLAACLVTLGVQATGGAFHAMTNLPLSARLGNAVISYWRYLGNLFYPANLAIFYPHPGSWPLVSVVVAGVGVLGVTALALALRRRHPYGPVGWFWYVGTLVPVIGLVQVGMQSLADRYAYIPSIGVFVVVVWGAHELTQSWRRQAQALGGVAAAILLACAVLTLRQIGYWADSEALFRRATVVTDRNWVMQNNLGQTLLSLPGRSAEAIEHFQAALRANPDYAEAHNNLGIALATIDRNFPAAIAEYRAALRIAPDYAEAHNNLGNALARFEGPSPAAIGEYEAALRLKPDYLEAHFNLANTLARLPARQTEAIAEYAAALRLRPDYAEAHFNLGNVLASVPARIPDAIAAYDAALRLKPDYAEAHNNLGSAWATIPDHLPDAIRHFEAALRIRPDMINAHYNLGIALMRTPGRDREAAAQFEAVLRINPAFEPARRKLEQLQATP